MREYCTSGSVRGAARKGSPYRGAGANMQEKLPISVLYLPESEVGLSFASILTSRRKATAGPEESWQTRMHS